MKKLLITTALVTSLAAISVQASPAIAQDDIKQIFSTVSTGTSLLVDESKLTDQIGMLSTGEMHETKGKWFGVGPGWFNLSRFPTTNMWHRSWW
jgi:hypothetical protein